MEVAPASPEGSECPQREWWRGFRARWPQRSGRPAAGAGAGGRRAGCGRGRRRATRQLQGEGELAVDRVAVLADDPEHGPVPPGCEAVVQRGRHRVARDRRLARADGRTVRPGDGEGGERRADRVVELQATDVGAVVSTAPSAGVALTRTAWAEAGAAEVTTDVNAPARISVPAGARRRSGWPGGGGRTTARAGDGKRRAGTAEQAPDGAMEQKHGRPFVASVDAGRTHAWCVARARGRASGRPGWSPAGRAAPVHALTQRRPQQPAASGRRRPTGRSGCSSADRAAAPTARTTRRTARRASVLAADTVNHIARAESARAITAATASAATVCPAAIEKAEPDDHRGTPRPPAARPCRACWACRAWPRTPDPGGIRSERAPGRTPRAGRPGPSRGRGRRGRRSTGADWQRRGRGTEAPSRRPGRGPRPERAPRPVRCHRRPGAPRPTGPRRRHPR